MSKGLAVDGREARALGRLRGLALAVLAGACGGRSGLEAASEEHASEGPAVLPPGAAPSLEGCAPPRLVSTGRVWLGTFAVESLGGELLMIPPGCEGHSFGAKRFSLPRFFLDPDEATNDCYAHCVAEGVCEPPAPNLDYPDHAWDDPARSRYPVRVDPTRAEAFCAFRGGRLATLAELTRAALGEKADFFQPDEVRSQAIACDNTVSEACDALYDRLYSFDSSIPWVPVRAYADDVGPFGHHDLSGSRCEYTASLVMTEEQSASYCTLAPDGAAPTVLGSGPLSYLLCPAVYLPNLAIYLEMAKEHAVGATYVLPYPIEDPYYASQAVRCAYDALEP